MLFAIIDVTRSMSIYGLNLCVTMQIRKNLKLFCKIVSCDHFVLCCLHQQQCGGCSSVYCYRYFPIGSPRH